MCFICRKYKFIATRKLRCLQSGVILLEFQIFCQLHCYSILAYIWIKWLQSGFPEISSKGEIMLLFLGHPIYSCFLYLNLFLVIITRLDPVHSRKPFFLLLLKKTYGESFCYPGMLLQFKDSRLAFENCNFWELILSNHQPKA